MNGSHLARAQALLDVHRPDDAIRILAEALAQDPEQPAEQIMLARALLLAGRAQESVHAAERAALLAPGRAEPHCIRADAYLDLEFFHQADEAAESACALEPGSVMAHFARTRSSLALNRADDAWTHANRVLELRPHGSLGRHARGLVLINRKQWKEAEREYGAALALSPDDPGLHNNYGLALLNLRRETEAMEHFTRAGQLDARRDLFRKNTVVAARRHLGESEDVRLPRPLVLIAPFGVLIAVVAAGSDDPVSSIVALSIAGAGFIAFLSVRRRRRRKRLPAAARVALEIDEQTRAGRGRLTRPEVRIFGVIGLAVVGLVALVIIGPGGGNSKSPSGPMITVPSDEVARALCELNRQTQTSDGLLAPPDDCPDTSSTTIP